MNNADSGKQGTSQVKVVTATEPADAGVNVQNTEEPAEAPEEPTATGAATDAATDLGLDTPTDAATEPGDADAPSCASICAVLVGPCEAEPSDCMAECTQDEGNSTSCGEQDQWAAMLACCAEASWAQCDEGSFDACQKDACGELRPAGAAEGCSPAGCGNEALDGDEECDDGNTESGDGCSSACRVEAAW